MLTHTGVLPNGYVGVDLFFALSGFLITTLLYEEWDRAGRISLRRFYGRRARRLLPALGLLIAVALLVDMLCYPMTGWPFAEKALTSLLFVNNWLAATGHAGDLGSLNPTWSLAQEEQFYLVWPLVLLLLLRRRARPQFVAALLLIAIGLLIAAAPIGVGAGLLGLLLAGSASGRAPLRLPRRGDLAPPADPHPCRRSPRRLPVAVRATLETAAPLARAIGGRPRVPVRRRCSSTTSSPPSRSTCVPACSRCR